MTTSDNEWLRMTTSGTTSDNEWQREWQRMTRCHSLSLVVPLVATCCRSLSFVFTRCTTLCHSLSLVEPLVITRCTTRCHSLSLVVPLVVTRCHSLWLDVPLVCLFINDPTELFLFHWTVILFNFAFAHVLFCLCLQCNSLIIEKSKTRWWQKN